MVAFIAMLRWRVLRSRDLLLRHELAVAVGHVLDRSLRLLQIGRAAAAHSVLGSLGRRDGERDGGNCDNPE